ncbi:hypothetical protein QPL47_20420 [Escherichia coli]|uniref:hypothetical protein n=1 Tax=Escherichia coli TaxID=562 RepID=UPI0028783C45|nr:hypothetical protein [Escherichia coli]EKR5642250.1 hypothetical protein [Escherichia coli]MDS1564569.1 hypothetical protein [Escherichia coli]
MVSLIGIDVSKAKLDVDVLRPDGRHRSKNALGGVNESGKAHSAECRDRAIPVERNRADQLTLSQQSCNRLRGRISRQK